MKKIVINGGRPLKGEVTISGAKNRDVYKRQKYDFRISQNPHVLTPFIDNKQLNNREDLQPHTFVDFNQIGGIKGALKYIVIGPARAVKYILKRMIKRK